MSRSHDPSRSDRTRHEDPRVRSVHEAFMREAIEETERRRAIQEEFNRKHGITPTSISKSIQDLLIRKKEEKRSLEKFYYDMLEDENVSFVKGKVAEVNDAGNGNVTVVAENAVTGEKIHQTVEMVVLATGMQPTAANAKLPADLTYNEDGFIINDFEKGGMFAAGCANKPADVVSSNQNATGMALKAIQTLMKR